MQPQTTIDAPKPEQALTWLEKANTCTITTPAQCEIAAEMLHGIADLRKLAEEHHRPIISSAHKTHKIACDALRSVDEPLAKAEQAIRLKLGAYAAEVRRREDAERRRIEEEARRRAEEEAEAAIAEAESQGASPAEVAALIAEAEAAPMVMVAPEPPKRVAAGISTTERWSVEVVNIRELCRGIAEGKVSPVMVLPNAAALNNLVRALRGSFDLPGCCAVKTTGIARR